MKWNYEMKSCSRCGGSGHYSYCTMYGTTCFKCGGSGKQLTRKGSAAKLRVMAIRETLYNKPVSSVVVGDKIFFEGRWVEVLGVRVQEKCFGSVNASTGETVWSDGVNLDLGKRGGYGMIASGNVQVWREMPEEVRAEIRALPGVIVTEEVKA